VVLALDRFVHPVSIEHTITAWIIAETGPQSSLHFAAIGLVRLQLFPYFILVCAYNGILYSAHTSYFCQRQTFPPLITDQVRTKRRGQAGASWYVDETYLKVQGKWCYLYRAIDQDGNVVDAMLSEKRTMETAQRFFQQAVDVVGHTPEQVTTDGHTSYPPAIHETMGSHVQHRTNKYLNHRLEQDHRGIKQRYYPMRGFGTVEASARFCCAFDELRTYLRPRSTMGEVVSLLEQRQAFFQRIAALQTLIQATSWLNEWEGEHSMRPRSFSVISVLTEPSQGFFG
jgi:transposase-like protein